MTKRTLVFLILILAAFAGLFAWATLQPPAPRPNITVAFVGYTNDMTGTRLATLTFSNASASPVRRLSYYSIQIPSPKKRWTNTSREWFTNGASVLSPGRAETVTVTVTALTNQPTWRVSFGVEPDATFVGDVRRLMIKTAQGLGIHIKHKTLYGVYSDWISE